MHVVEPAVVGSLICKGFLFILLTLVFTLHECLQVNTVVFMYLSITVMRSYVARCRMRHCICRLYDCCLLLINCDVMLYWSALCMQQIVAAMVENWKKRYFC